MRLIDADEVHERIDIACNRLSSFKIDKWSLHAMVEDIRTVDAVKHGHWVKHENEPYLHNILNDDGTITKEWAIETWTECSVCKIPHFGVGIYDVPYCSHCGAMMNEVIKRR